MTPQLVPQLRAVPGEGHLTGEQFGELLARFTEDDGTEPTPAEAHLQACEACTAELASLREAITLFREASDAYAEQELRGIPRWRLPNRRVFSHTFVPAYWFVAAAMFLTALLPLQVMRRHARGTPPAMASTAMVSNAASSAQSDEALLEDVNRDISATVPTSMQALDDPSDDATVAGSESSNATTNERKD
jgi:anti-sigma factor RsiW